MIETTRIFLPLVLKVKGRIVIITSMLGRIGVGPAPYVVSKFAAEGYSDVLRYSLDTTVIFIVFFRREGSINKSNFRGGVNLIRFHA